MSFLVINSNFRMEMEEVMESNDCPYNSNNSSNYEEYNGNGGKPFQNGFITRQFDVLDEVNEDKNTGSENDTDDSDYYESEVPDEEIEAMLEEGLPEEFRARKRRKLNNDNSGNIYIRIYYSSSNSMGNTTPQTVQSVSIKMLELDEYFSPTRTS